MGYGLSALVWLPPFIDVHMRAQPQLEAQVAARSARAAQQEKRATLLRLSGYFDFAERGAHHGGLSSAIGWTLLPAALGGLSEFFLFYQR